MHMILTILAKLEIPLCKFDDSKFHKTVMKELQQQRIQLDFDTVDVVSAPKLWCPKKRTKNEKTKICSNLK